MKTRVQRWGNSLALRIPRAFATTLGISEESTLEMTIFDGKLVISIAEPPELTLTELLAGVTDENLHGEISMGPAVGEEAW